nr:YopX family protein [uncultured Ruminococcus sp.]
MREILFRGKRKTNGEWIYGDYFRSKICNTELGIRVVHSITFFQNGEEYSYTIDPDTIGQYTGLTDKNGKKIFEGDIVKHLSDNMVYLIEYDNRFGMYVSKQKNSSYSGCIRCEIIGNIYDNPELLEGQS